MKAGNPYSLPVRRREIAREARKDPPKAGRSDAARADKPRFDFYKILPGVEEPKVQAKAGERRTAPTGQARRSRRKAPTRPSPKRRRARRRSGRRPRRPKPPERFWLQAGSFASEADAENLKARLAFAGWEAASSRGRCRTRASRFRVRLGPYDNTDELNRIKSELAKRGFDAAVIKF